MSALSSTSRLAILLLLLLALFPALATTPVAVAQNDDDPAGEQTLTAVVAQGVSAVPGPDER